MSSYTNTVTGRDLLSWAIEQGTFTDNGIRQNARHVAVTAAVDGPWPDLLGALMTAAAEGLSDPGSGIDRGGWLEGFEKYVEEQCLANIVQAFSLDADQAAVVLRLAEEIRLFFEGTVGIDSTGLDGPITGDLSYHCGFDYRIQIPEWAIYRAN